MSVWRRVFVKTRFLFLPHSNSYLCVALPPSPHSNSYLCVLAYHLHPIPTDIYVLASLPPHPIPTAICVLASSLSPDIPEKTIITESGIAPRRGRTTPPMIAAGSPRSSNSSAPSGHNNKIEYCVLAGQAYLISSWLLLPVAHHRRALG